MLLIYLAIYIIVLLIVGGFYAVARMHTLKFKRFSTHIVPVTNFLLIFLIILSILGFILIFLISPDDNPNSIINSSTSSENIDPENEDSVDYKDEIIGDEYY